MKVTVGSREPRGLIIIIIILKLISPPFPLPYHLKTIPPSPENMFVLGDVQGFQEKLAREDI